MKNNFNKILSIIFIVITVVSCASDENKPDPTDEELFNTAKTSLEKKNYKKAVENFQEIERLYPFSKLAGQAQVMAAYAHYKDEEYDQAVIVIDNFIKINPGHKDVAYMYYLKAMCYYDQIADIKRDQNNTKQALTALEEVTRRFPDSDYGRDAKIKIDLVRDHLAGKEMEVGRFYLKQGKYIAAANRFKEVVDNYQTTTHIEEALYRLVETNTMLGLYDEAKRNAAVLGKNYPSSKWYKYAYNIVGEGNAPAPKESNSWIPKIPNIFGNEKGADSEKLSKENKADSILDRFLSKF